MTITAKFSSKCPKCLTAISEGEKVEWTPGSKATHVVCPLVRNEGDCLHPAFHKAQCHCAKPVQVKNTPVSEEVYEAVMMIREFHEDEPAYRTYDADDYSYDAWAKAHGTAQVAAPVARLAVEDAGVYVMPDGGIVKVQANQDKTRTYAKRWVVIGGERLNETDDRVHGEYQYEPGLVQQVATQGRKMTLDEAKAFILRYGQCARCSRKLVAAKSVEAGIGPVCIKYFSAGTTAVDLMGVAA